LRGGEADVAIQYGGGRAHGAHQPNGGDWQSAALDRRGLRPRDDGMGVGAAVSGEAPHWIAAACGLAMTGVAMDASTTMNAAGEVLKP